MVWSGAAGKYRRSAEMSNRHFARGDLREWIRDAKKRRKTEENSAIAGKRSKLSLDYCYDSDEPPASPVSLEEDARRRTTNDPSREDEVSLTSSSPSFGSLISESESDERRDLDQVSDESLTSSEEKIERDFNELEEVSEIPLCSKCNESGHSVQNCPKVKIARDFDALEEVQDHEHERQQSTNQIEKDFDDLEEMNNVASCSNSAANCPNAKIALEGINEKNDNIIPVNKTRDHLTKECPNNPPTNCYNCGLRGHHPADQCPGLVCAKCGRHGHFVRDCFLAPPKETVSFDYGHASTSTSEVEVTKTVKKKKKKKSLLQHFKDSMPHLGRDECEGVVMIQAWALAGHTEQSLVQFVQEKQDREVTTLSKAALRLMLVKEFSQVRAVLIPSK